MTQRWPFWRNVPDNPGIIARLLSPITHVIHHLASRHIRRTKGLLLPIPVLSLGVLNRLEGDLLITSIAVIQHLQALGKRPVVVMRSDQSDKNLSRSVDPRADTAAKVGDRPLLLAAFCPVWIGHDLVETAQNAANHGDIILLYDGHQEASIHKNLSLLVASDEHGFGNARLWPAGPLRETLGAGLMRADLLLMTGSGRQTQQHDPCQGITQDLPVIRARRTVLETGMDWSGMPVMAFTGTSAPEIFYQILHELGADIRRKITLTPGQPLPTPLLKRLENEAALTRAQLVTTEQDATRLPRGFQQKVLSLPMRLQIDDGAALISVLRRENIL